MREPQQLKQSDQFRVVISARKQCRRADEQVVKYSPDAPDIALVVVVVFGRVEQELWGRIPHRTLVIGFFVVHAEGQQVHFAVLDPDSLGVD